MNPQHSNTYERSKEFQRAIATISDFYLQSEPIPSPRYRMSLLLAIQTRGTVLRKYVFFFFAQGLS
jgi:hypothetical protein